MRVCVSVKDREKEGRKKLCGIHKCSRGGVRVIQGSGCDWLSSAGEAFSPSPSSL